MSISFGGINYNVEMAKSLANIANVFNSVVLRNANAGLGIGQKIRNVINKYKESIERRGTAGTFGRAFSPYEWLF